MDEGDEFMPLIAYIKTLKMIIFMVVDNNFMRSG